VKHGLDSNTNVATAATILILLENLVACSYCSIMESFIDMKFTFVHGMVWSWSWMKFRQI